MFNILKYGCVVIFNYTKKNINKIIAYSFLYRIVSHFDRYGNTFREKAFPENLSMENCDEWERSRIRKMVHTLYMVVFW